jgi:SAM-dependent methyltransferase
VSERSFSYPPAALRLYDFVAYRVDAPLLWRCSVRDLLALYDEQVSGRHLDVGVGTGYLLDRCRFPVPAPQLTLMDVNPGPLAYAARRLRRYAPRCHRADMLGDWGLPAGSFDSVALGNVLVCAPGALPQKAVAFEHARACLAPGGRLFGATVLNGGVEHTRRSRFAMRMLNRRGVFDNLGDHREDLDAALSSTFDSHQIRVRGSAALFTARMEG